MERWQLSWLGLKQFPAELTEFDLNQYFVFDVPDRKLIESRRRGLHRLSVALQIGFIRLSGKTLSAVDVVPVNVLSHVCHQLHLPAPEIASLRALYKRQRTLFDHQRLARRATGFRELSDAAQRVLIGQLRQEAESKSSVDALIESANQWLYEKQYLIPHRRKLYDLARAAIRHDEQRILHEIKSLDTHYYRKDWVVRLCSVSVEPSQSVLEWLQQPPRRHHKRRLAEIMAKRDALAEMGAVNISLPSVSSAKRYYYAKRIMRRRPSMLKRIREPLRTIEIACFLRHQLLSLTDTILELSLHRINDIRRKARDETLLKNHQQRGDYIQLVRDLNLLSDQTGLTTEQLRDQLKHLITPHLGVQRTSRTAEIRASLQAMQSEVQPFLKVLTQLPLDTEQSPGLAEALSVLGTQYDRGDSQLPVDVGNPFGVCWQSLIEAEDRQKALAGYEAATMVTLQRSLKNGSANTEQSNAFRNPDALFIPVKTWKKSRTAHYRLLSLPQSPRTYIKPIRAALSSGLEQLDDAIRNQELSVVDDRIRLTRPAKSQKPAGLVPLRRKLLSRIGPTQLPDVLLEVDSQTRFSKILLGRSPRHERELITVYAALLALGSDLSAADIVRMIPILTADIVEPMIARLEHDKVIQSPNDHVVKFMRSHSTSKLWGPGVSMSADMMSLEATRHLWLSRLDPRRRAFAVGTYTHVLDQWGIVYDQPIVLNKRQAGAALQGALAQQHIEVARVAVDTHGFTHAAMALAKLVGFDLCPRLAKLADRKLYVPKDITVPTSLEPIVNRHVSWRSIERHWDPLIRVAASMSSGWCSASLTLDRFGSAAQGNPTYSAAVSLGKILRSIYLCDYLSCRPFRTEILSLLNQGESVHILQRALYNGPVGAKHGRRPEQLTAISSALTLLTNIVMAFNTHRLQKQVDEDPSNFPKELLAHIAPHSVGHINLRGTFSFGIDRYRSKLFDVPVKRKSRAQSSSNT